MVRRSLVIACVALFASATPAHAKTCADYPNQAAAQVAHDTIDADGDGIFCETLPCPCLKPGAPNAPLPVPALGTSIPLGHVTKRRGCRVHDGLPDRRCTPGARFSKVTRADVCRPGYARSVRHVTEATKDKVYAAYGMSTRFDGQDGEVDHLVSLELGGSNARANLFPEAASPRPGSHEKDRLENALHRDVCDGRISLHRAQRLIAKDWVAAFHARLI